SARVSTAAAAFAWSARRIFVRGSHGSRASATAATRPPRTAATSRLRHIRPRLLDELLRERLLERDELAAEDGGRDNVQGVLEPPLADEDEVADERHLVPTDLEHHSPSI